MAIAIGSSFVVLKFPKYFYFIGIPVAAVIFIIFIIEKIIEQIEHDFGGADPVAVRETRRHSAEEERTSNLTWPASTPAEPETNLTEAKLDHGCRRHLHIGSSSSSRDF